jgi:hypothetical protein
MKWINYLFFNLYNWYYKDGMYNRRINPCDCAIYLLSLGTGFWLIVFGNLFSNIFYGSNLHYDKSQIMYYAIIPFLVYIFYNNYFYFSDRYLRIYNQFIEYSKTNGNKKRDLIITFTIVIIPFPIIVIWTIISNYLIPYVNSK